MVGSRAEEDDVPQVGGSDAELSQQASHSLLCFNRGLSQKCLRCVNVAIIVPHILFILCKSDKPSIIIIIIIYSIHYTPPRLARNVLVLSFLSVPLFSFLILFLPKESTLNSPRLG